MKKYLITGITGTMGQELCKLILQKIPNAYVIGISRDEQKQRLLPKHDRVTHKLADIRDINSLHRAVGKENIIDCVFHLAALKCVDTLEDNVDEAVATNVIGTQNVVSFCDDFGCDLVMASTDKACYPINAYGNTKALAERLVTSAGYKVARYGNVIGSRGSFIPHIVKCLKEGIPVPITDSEMTRFWIKAPNVAKFLLDVSEYKKTEIGKGDIHIPKMFSCHITVLIQAISDILGVPNYTLNVVGIRPGEKIHETLQMEHEGELVTSETSLCRYTQLLDYLGGLV